MFNEISTNTLSFLDAFRAACMDMTSMTFKVCYVAGLLASLCAVVAQSAITLLLLPSATNQELSIPFLTNPWGAPVGVPWSADPNLAPWNGAIIQPGQLGTSYAYLEEVAGVRVWDALPSGYLVPLITRTNDTTGYHYPSDVAHVQCECSWVAPTLPPATNASYILVALENVSISGLQKGPLGLAGNIVSKSLPIPCCVSLLSLVGFSPLSNMTFFNSTPVTSGLFAWTLW
jgi:hypothetical protein